MKTAFILYFFPTLTSAFSVNHFCSPGGVATSLFSSAVDDTIYQGYADEWMEYRKVEREKKQEEDRKPKIQAFEADYLAAAKARAAQKPRSLNSQAKDEDWQQVMEEKRKQYGIKNIGSAEEWEEAARNAEGEIDDDEEFKFFNKEVS